MPLAFISRNPTPLEVERFRLAMSTFCDGSGEQTEKDGSTRPGWRQIERVCAAVLGGDAPENKDVFDVVLPCDVDAAVDYGLSVKSKELSRRVFERLNVDTRVYMELSNSPAKFFDALGKVGITVQNFLESNPKAVGDTVMATVSQWHEEAKIRHETLLFNGRKLNIAKSVFLVVSHTPPVDGLRRRYQIHAFSLPFPKNMKWEYPSPKCLRGYDPAYPKETLVDWYGLSGGQLKYYPRGTAALWHSEQFTLEQPVVVPITAKAARLFPEQWLKAKGKAEYPNETVAAEIERLAIVMADKRGQAIARKFAEELRKTR